MMKKGFTLVELLVALSIMAVILTASLGAFSGSRAIGRDGRRKSDLESIRSGLELYRNDCGSYPVALSWGNSLVGNGTTCAAANVYIQTVPRDPITTQNYYYSLAGSVYQLCAKLEIAPGVVQNCGGANLCGGVTCNYRTTNP